MPENPHDREPSDMTALVNGVLVRVHAPSECAGHHCWVHNPSDHHMITWPVQWTDRQTAERVCGHGLGHPDPDDVAYHRRKGREVSVHGCDGCCGLTPPGMKTYRLGEQVERLGPNMGGRWLVTTQGSEHIWDLDEMTYCRLPGESSRRFDHDSRFHPIDRVEWWPAVGECSLIFYTDPHERLIEQWRQSSTIRRIERLVLDGSETGDD